MRRSNFLFLLIFGIVLWGPETLGQDYCQIDAQGQAQVEIGHFSDLSPERVKEHQALQQKLLQLETELQLHLDQALILTTPLRGLGPTQHLKGLEQEIEQVRGRLETWLRQSPSSQRSVSHQLIELYFSAAQSQLLLTALKTPQSMGLGETEGRLGLTLDPLTVNALFPGQNEVLPGLSLRPRQASQARGPWLLSLSRENFYRILVQAAARSPEFRQSGQAYVETLRCILSRTHLGKISAHHLLTGSQDSWESALSLNFNSTDPVCLGASFQDLLEIARDIPHLEGLLRSQVSTELPGLSQEFSPPSAELIGRLVDLNYPLAQAYVLAHDQSLMAEYLVPTRESSSPQFRQMLREVETQVGRFYRDYQFLAPLRGLLSQERFASKILDVYQSCNYLGTDDSMSTDQMLTSLKRAEDYLFPLLLQSELFQVHPVLAEIRDQKRAEDFFVDYLAEVRFRAVLSSLEMMTQLTSYLTTPRTEETMALLKELLGPTLREAISKELQSPAIRTWARQQGQKLTEAQRRNQGQEEFKNLFATQLRAKAQDVRQLLDPESPSYELPFNFNAILRAMKDQVLKLSPEILTQFDQMAQLYPQGQHREFWRLMDRSLQSQMLAQGTACQAPTLSQRARGFLGLGEGPRSAQRQVLAQQKDCDSLRLLAGLLALDQTEDPQTMRQSLFFAQTQLRPKELETFVTAYRNELAIEIFNNHRLLTEKTKPGPLRKSQALYEVLTEEMSQRELVSRLEAAAVQAQQTLNEDLQLILGARRPEDFGHLISRSNMINAALGEYAILEQAQELTPLNLIEGSANLSELALEGFVFPHLARQHQRLQSHLARDFRVRQEIWDEFIHTMVWINLGILGTQGIKWLFLRAPLKSLPGATSAASGLNIALLNLNQYSTAMGVSLISLIGSHLPILTHRQVQFKRQQAHIERQFLADLLEPGSFDNPLPVLDWATYRNQQLYFQQLVRTTYTQMAWSAFFVSLPVAIIYGSRLNSTVLQPKALKKSERSLKDLSFEERALLVRKLNHKYSRDLRVHALDLKNLRGAKSFRLSELQTQLNSIRAQPRHPLEIKRAEQAYERIIMTAGRQADSLKSHEQLLTVYARSIHGPQSRAEDLYPLIREYHRLLKSGGSGL